MHRIHKIALTNVVFGFSLIELMVVVTIIGILASIASPGYRKHVANAKMAEGYVALSDLSKKEAIHHGSYNEFYGLGSRNPSTLDQTMVMAATGNWSATWIPTTVGAHTWFSYNTVAGKTNSAGTELNTGPNTGNTLQTSSVTGFADASYTTGSPTSCTASGNPTATTFGVTTTNLYDWVVITAVGDLDNKQTSTCTIIYRLLEASPATNGNVKSRNPVVLNPYN